MLWRVIYLQFFIIRRASAGGNALYNEAALWVLKLSITRIIFPFYKSTNKLIYPSSHDTLTLEGYTRTGTGGGEIAHT